MSLFPKDCPEKVAASEKRSFFMKYFINLVAKLDEAGAFLTNSKISASVRHCFCDRFDKV
jgi:hypothetical protein